VVAVRPSFAHGQLQVDLRRDAHGHRCHGGTLSVGMKGTFIAPGDRVAGE
jgi:hypothetical protein